jgi:CHAT domain-containing protein
VFAPTPAEHGASADGILTAEEVNSLELHGTRLVVLSACDTGLGDVAGGEGVLGLQRAFRVAGARRVLTSLWKVDDAATAALMEQFYTRVWQQGISEIEALRQAQLHLLRDPSVLAASRQRLNEQLQTRGLVLESQSGATATPDLLRHRTHPRLWAAFVLNGSLLDERPQ